MASPKVAKALPHAPYLDSVSIIRQVNFVALDCGAVLAIFARQVWSQIQAKEVGSPLNFKKL